MRLNAILYRLPGAPPSAPVEIDASPSWTVRELGAAVQAALPVGGLTVSLIFNPAREGVLPPQGECTCSETDSPLFLQPNQC